MIKRETGYYDFDLDFEALMEDEALVDDMMYIRDLKQRKLILNSNINQFTVADYIRQILQFNTEDMGLPVEERQPILFYITSNGGDVDAGFGLINTILNSKTPVYTINLSFQYSMGFLIGLAGHKRFANRDARFLIHDGSGMIYGSGTKMRDQMRFEEKAEERTKQYVLSRSNLTSEEYDENLRVEWYLFADEAKEKGFTDYIIGVDCDIDEVI